MDLVKSENSAPVGFVWLNAYQFAGILLPEYRSFHRVVYSNPFADISMYITFFDVILIILNLAILNFNRLIYFL